MLSEEVWVEVNEVVMLECGQNRSRSRCQNFGGVRVVSFIKLGLSLSVAG